MAFSLEKFFFNTPIYFGVKLDEDDIKSSEFKALFNYQESRNLEGYNPLKKVHSTFVLTQKLPSGDFIKKGGFGALYLKCKRYESEFRFYIYYFAGDRTIIKIGQFPSVADFHLTNIKHYKKIIPEDKLKEFSKAIGLAAHGIGIGSFVYLRRIFEYLINEAYNQAKLKGKIIEDDFLTARMDEKIDLLKDFLPHFLIQNKSIYSILSLGIHELDEKNCLAHFDILKDGIEIIMDEKLDEIRKNEKAKLANRNINVLNTKLKK